jgi:hypothetical protein
VLDDVSVVELGGEEKGLLDLEDDLWVRSPHNLHGVGLSVLFRDTFLHHAMCSLA